jgi:hypothetical protein
MSIVNRVTELWGVPVGPPRWVGELGGLTHLSLGSCLPTLHTLIHHCSLSFITTSPCLSLHPLIHHHILLSISVHPSSLSVCTLVCQHAPSFISAHSYSCTTHHKLHMLACAHVPTLVCTLFCLCTCCKSIPSTLILFLYLPLFSTCIVGLKYLKNNRIVIFIAITYWNPGVDVPLRR